MGIRFHGPMQNGLIMAGEWDGLCLGLQWFTISLKKLFVSAGLALVALVAPVVLVAPVAPGNLQSQLGGQLPVGVCVCVRGCVWVCVCVGRGDVLLKSRDLHLACGE